MEHQFLPLAKAFAGRPERFRMLESGISATKWSGGEHLLEIGCSRGDASAFMAEQGFRVTAIDLDRHCIEEAVAAHLPAPEGMNLQFLCVNAEKMPFQSGVFDGIYSEAAFSPMPNKSRCLTEYARIIKLGGYVLVNDFAIKGQIDEEAREEVIHIPCFAGVQTMDCYRNLFEKAGFRLVFRKEDFSELLRISMWLCKVYNVRPAEIGGYLSSYFQMGVTSCPSYNGAMRSTSFFRDTQLTYCQMIFEKE